MADDDGRVETLTLLRLILIRRSGRRGCIGHLILFGAQMFVTGLRLCPRSLLSVVGVTALLLLSLVQRLGSSICLR